MQMLFIFSEENPKHEDMSKPRAVWISAFECIEAGGTVWIAMKSLKRVSGKFFS